MYHYQENIVDSNGTALNGWSIDLYAVGGDPETAPAVTIYSDRAGTTAIPGGKVRSVAKGFVEFYVPSGAYSRRYYNSAGVYQYAITDSDLPTTSDDLASTASGKGAALVGLEQGGTVQKAINYVTPKMFGVVGDGVADDTTAYTAALNYASANELELRGGGETIRLTSQISLNAGIRLGGKQTILLGNYASFGLLIAPPLGSAVSVSAVTTATYPTVTGLEYSGKVTVSSSASFAVGDIILLYSEDTYSFDAAKKKGELLNIVAIVGNDLYVGTTPRWSYATSINVRKLSNRAIDKIVIGDGIEFAYDGTASAVAVTCNRFGALGIKGAINPEIYATFRDDISSGLVTYSCWQTTADFIARDLRVNYGLAMYGYGYFPSGSDRNGITSFLASKCGHAVTPSTSPPTEPALYGVPIGLLVHDSIVMDATRAAFDTHPGATNTTFSNCLAIGGFTDTDQSDRGTLNGYQDRGLNTTFDNCSSRNVRAPFKTDAISDSYGEANNTIINGGVHRQNLTTASALLFNALALKTGTDTNRIVFNNVRVEGYQPYDPGNSPNLQHFIGCEFVATGSYGIAWGTGLGNFRFERTTFRNFTTLRLGANNNVTMLDCRRINETGTFIEPLIVTDGATFTFDGYYAEAASYANSSIIRLGSTGAGAVTVNAGSMSAKGFPTTYPSPISVNGSTTLTFAKMELVHGGSATWDPPSLATGAQQTTTVTVPGAALGDMAQASFSLSLAGTRLWAEVTAANTVTVYQRNDTGAPVDLASGTLRVQLVKA